MLLIIFKREELKKKMKINMYKIMIILYYHRYYLVNLKVVENLFNNSNYHIFEMIRNLF
jgi:hypothetical protein